MELGVEPLMRNCWFRRQRREGPAPPRQADSRYPNCAREQRAPLFPFLRGGCLDGIQGILVARNDDRSLLISVNLILQLVAIRIEGCEVAVLAEPRSSAA